MAVRADRAQLGELKCHLLPSGVGGAEVGGIAFKKNTEKFKRTDGHMVKMKVWRSGLVLRSAMNFPCPFGQLT